MAAREFRIAHAIGLCGTLMMLLTIGLALSLATLQPAHRRRRLRMARRVMSFLVGGWLLLIQAISHVFGDPRERDGPYERQFLFVGPC
jgi:hypothetical protein